MPTPSFGLDGFNGLTDAQRMHLLGQVCSSAQWTREVLSGQPFGSVGALLDRADRALAGLSDAEFSAALDGHPRIGGPVDNASSAREQAGLAHAGDAIRAELAAGNAAYEQKFGCGYLVCATGLSAEQLLASLTGRLHNDPQTERRVMRAEMIKINRLRLQCLLSAPKGPS
jgi:2-oxo-4-hydroxy-4-carboxy-5-ureidoimidazoline decarboxylase